MSGGLPADAPVYCPRCGRALFYSYWNTVDYLNRYNYLVCFNGASDWYRWLLEKIKVTEVGGVHYRYSFGRTANLLKRCSYDPLTGRRR